MKKAISIFLALLLCLSLCACGGDDANAEKAIVGKWKSFEGRTATFNEDGTGEAPYGGDFTWKFDKETNWYMISSDGLTLSCEIKTENEIRSISIGGNTYYHADDYEKAAGIE